MQCAVWATPKNAAGGINLLELNRNQLKLETNKRVRKIARTHNFYSTLADLNQA